MARHIPVVNGTRFEAHYAPGEAPVSRLYKNNRDGTFTDVTVEGGGWSNGRTGCCIGDYNNDGSDDLFVTYWGDCSLSGITATAHSPMWRRRPE